MQTLYYLEHETRQKIKDLHKEKAHERLQQSATEDRPHLSRLQSLRKVLAQLVRLPRHHLHLSQPHRKPIMDLERSLDEA